MYKGYIVVKRWIGGSLLNKCKSAQHIFRGKIKMHPGEPKLWLSSRPDSHIHKLSVLELN